MLIALGLYIVGIVIMGAVVFYVGKQVLEILSQPVAKIIVGAICAFIVFGTIKELQVGFSWSNIALLAGAIVGIVIIEYSRAAEPPVQCGVSHLSRRTEPHCL